MNRSVVFLSALALCIPVVLGCSSAGSPLSPGPGLSPASPRASTASDTVLWGYFDVYVDVEDGTIEAVANRHGMFTANVVNFLNSNPLSMKFKINEIVSTADYIDVDINVGITHPFPGMQQYDGYDVRGVFMGDGSAILESTGVSYALSGTDQSMLDDPDSGGSDMPGGGPDGYTRWFNLGEFQGPGMPLFKYTPGNLASNGFAGTATLNPYKYFSDGLDTFEDVWSWLNSNADQHGVFSSGAMNERNYYLRFPTGKGVKYGYAVIANWTGSEPEYHPSNAAEAVSCKVDDNSTVYYVDPSNKGGDLLLDISLFGWMYQPSTIIVESTVLSSPHELSGSEMIPVGGTENYSTYHVEIPADDIVGSEGNEYWIIARFDGFDYSNDFGVMNDAWDDPLAAYFRHDLYVSPVQGNQAPICSIDVVTEMPVSAWGVIPVEFDASGSSDPEGLPITFEWDFDNDGTFGDAYDSGTDANPTKVFDFTNQEQVCVRVTDDKGLSSDCCVDVDIQVLSAKNIPLRDDESATDLAVEPNGSLLILYEDGQVWRYTEASCFSQSGAQYVFTGQVVPFSGNAQITNHRIDVNTTGQIIASAASGDCDAQHGWPAQVFDSNGNQLGSAPSPCTAGPVPDVLACRTGGSYDNSMVVLAPHNTASNYQNNMYRKFAPFSGPWWTQNYGPGPFPAPEIGYLGLWLGYVKGAESVNADRWWVVKDPGNPSTQDYYASRWVQDTYFYYHFDNAWFGTGNQTGSDDGWYNAKDITIDSSGHLYVLDELSSGQGRIKVFETGSPGSALTDNAAGDADSISEEPLRIEGSSYVSPAYGNLIFVLHGNGIPSRLSVFFASDFDW